MRLYEFVSLISLLRASSCDACWVFLPSKPLQNKNESYNMLSRSPAIASSSNKCLKLIVTQYLMGQVSAIHYMYNLKNICFLPQNGSLQWIMFIKYGEVYIHKLVLKFINGWNTNSNHQTSIILGPLWGFASIF